jgi:ribosomal-protein-alanine N-acetyltransferase
MPTRTPSLRTARLRLRPYRPDDFETVFRELVLDPVVIRFWHDYADPALSDERRRSMAEDDFGDWVGGAIAAGYPVWTIEATGIESVTTGTFVGVTGILPPENEWGPEPEVGLMLASRFHGRGLGTEALTAVVDAAFARLGLPRVVAIIDEPNAASNRMVEKVGFSLERSYIDRDGLLYRRYVVDAPS